MCLRGCDLTLRDLVDANLEKLELNLEIPELPYKSSQELIEKSMINLRDRSS